MDDIRLIEIAEGVAGPSCALQFADLGADVIKVEPPGGDRTREWGPPFNGDDAAIFSHLNRGKKSVVLDLTTSEGRDRVEVLLRDADAAIVQIDPAEREAIGIDWKKVAAANERLVLCEIDDFGEVGPLAGLSGSELSLQAMSGLTRYIGEPGGEPCRLGFEISACAVAMYAYHGLVAALINRQKTGLGQYFRTSGLGSLISLKTILLAAQSGDWSNWSGFHLNGPHWPADIGWATKDGQVTFDFRHGERDQWVKFCNAVGLGHLPDHPDYADWRSTIYIGDRRFEHGKPYREVFAKMTCEEASGLINGIGGISVKFHDYAEALAHPQMQTVSPLVDVPDEGPAARTQLGHPFRFAGEERRTSFGRAPRLGEQTNEVLAALHSSPGARRKTVGGQP